MPYQSTYLFDALTEINDRPRPFETYTAENLWNDEHISKKMLGFHLDPDSAPASRPHAFIHQSAEWINERFSLSEGKHVADFGCGPGLYASRFAKTGAAVTGIDFSKRSIDYATSEAKKQGLSIEYLLGDYLNFQSERKFDLISMVYCDLCPLSPDQRQHLLSIFRDHLAVGGSILLDVFSLEAFSGRQETADLGFRFMDGFWSPGDYWGFMNTFKYEKAKVAVDKYTIVEPHQSRSVFNWMQFFSIESLTREFEQCGLRIVEKYADVAGTPYADGEVFAVVAERI